MDDLARILDEMDPEQAMTRITAEVKKLFPHLSEKARLNFLYAFTGQADEETVPGLVHL